jgi:hypothetical protein
MAIEDNDLIDRALDAAELKLAEETPEPAVEATEPKSDVIEDAETLKQVKEATEGKRASKERDESGRFLKKDQKQTKVSKEEPSKQEESLDQKATEGELEAAEPQEAEQPIESPQFWSPEHKALFAKAPRDVQQAVLHYEAQRNDWANRVANEAQRGKAIESRVTEVFEPYRLKMQANGIKDPMEAAQRLLAWNEIFETDPKTGIVELMQRNGLSPQDFMGSENEPQYVQDPRLEQALTEAREAKKLVEEQKAYYEQQRVQAMQSSIEAFKAGKDSSGQVRKPFAELYAPQITQATERIQAQYPAMPLDQALNHAYEFVLLEARKAFGVTGNGTPKTAQVAKPQEQIIAEAKKANAAASSVSGAPSTGVINRRPSAKTVDEAIDRAFEIVEGSRA